MTSLIFLTKLYERAENNNYQHRYNPFAISKKKEARTFCDTRISPRKCLRLVASACFVRLHLGTSKTYLELLGY